jgi:hypothetical protein
MEAEEERPSAAAGKVHGGGIEGCRGEELIDLGGGVGRRLGREIRECHRRKENISYLICIDYN